MTGHPILSAARMKACDTHTIRDLGTPSRTLMERAAAAVVDALDRHADLFPGHTVTVLCGRGNNGGDGFAVARLLAESGANTPDSACVARVIYAGPWTIDRVAPDTGRMSAECAVQYELAYAAGVVILPPESAEALTSVMGGARDGTIVDALFGIGLDRPFAAATEALLARLRATGQPVLAVDIPSGVHADTGEILGGVLPATLTVTMQALKPGLLLYPGAAYAGRIEIADIGVSLEDPRGADTPTGGLNTPHPEGAVADRTLLPVALPPRHRRTHKGTYGQLALLCGSTGMSGAAVLATKSSLRTGVGLARVITPSDNRLVLQTTTPEAIVTTYDPDTPALDALAAAVSACDGLVAGCGLGTTDTAAAVLRTALDALPADAAHPVVLDADALNLLAADPTLWETAALSSPDRRVVITPHPAEMARLSGLPVTDILADPLAVARGLAARRGVTVVLKDAHTVIASPTGGYSICRAGNAGMATGGSGDVLAGILGAILTQRRAALPDADALTTLSSAAVYLHAAAGDSAAARVGEYSLVAGDIVDAIADIIRPLSDTRTPPFIGD